MKRNWWKWTGFILVLYSLIAGLGVPLAPGIKSLSPENSTAGITQTINIQTLNARFKTFPAHLQLALSNENVLLRPTNFKVISENALEASFVIPLSLDPGKGNARSLDLLLSTDHDGLLVRKQAFEITNTGASTLPTKTAASTHDQALTKALVKDKFAITRQSPVYFSFPYREILYESIRNNFYHIAMWFSMLLVFLISVIYSVRYLRTGKASDDQIACEALYVGLFFGILGLVTGSLWAKVTWGDWWPNDAKLNGTLISLLVYFAYVILRNSLDDEEKRARISAVYNIFAFPMMFVLIMVLPRLTDSLHPGNGGNPAFSTQDLDNHLRVVSYPAWIGWMLIAVWLLQIRVRLRRLEHNRLVG